MKKIIIISILFLYTLTFPVSSKNDLYQKIDVFGEVLENIREPLRFESTSDAGSLPEVSVPFISHRSMVRGAN